MPRSSRGMHCSTRWRDTRALGRRGAVRCLLHRSRIPRRSEPAGWRVSTNDPIRQPDRDRGIDKNRLNDIQGVIGELIGIRVVERLAPPPVAITHDLLDLRGPVNDVDITATFASGAELR